MRMGDKEEPTQISEWADEQNACQYLHTFVQNSFIFPHSRTDR